MRADSPNPGEETARRRAIAERVVEVLVRRSMPAASLLSGSVALGISDSLSDIDLLNYYERLPDPGAFAGWMAEAGATELSTIAEPDGDAFLSAYMLDGVQVQTGAQTIESIEREVRMIEAADVNMPRAKVATGLLEGVALHGPELIERWRERVSYPEALRRKEVDDNLGIFPIWAVDEQLAARDAELFRRQMLLDGAFRILAVLSALNRLYFTTFQFKRSGAHVAHMRVKPDGLAERLNMLANAPPGDAVEVLRLLTVETRALVEREMPGVDAGVAWRPPHG